jgi:hypothetical protein
MDSELSGGKTQLTTSDGVNGYFQSICLYFQVWYLLYTKTCHIQLCPEARTCGAAAVVAQWSVVVLACSGYELRVIGSSWCHHVEQQKKTNRRVVKPVYPALTKVALSIYVSCDLVSHLSSLSHLGPVRPTTLRLLFHRMRWCICSINRVSQYS